MTPPSTTQAELTSPPIKDADLVADLNRQLTEFLKSMPRVPLRIRIESPDGGEGSPNTIPFPHRVTIVL